jgi:hypothetical protein
MKDKLIGVFVFILIVAWALALWDYLESKYVEDKLNKESVCVQGK